MASVVRPDIAFAPDFMDSLAFRLTQASIVLALFLASTLGCRDQAEALFADARRAVAEDNFEQAVRLFREVTIVSPESAEAAQAHYELAQIYYLRLREVDAAFDSLWTVLGDYPESPVVTEARRLLARLYEEDFRSPDKALPHYLTLLEQEDDASSRRQTLLSIANCHYRLNQLDRSAEAYRRVLELPYHSDADGAYLRLANLEWLAGNPDEALHLLRELQERTQDETRRYDARLSEVDLLTSLGRFEEVRTRLADARKSYPGAEELDELQMRVDAVEFEHRSLDGHDQAALLKELQNLIRWGGGRRRRGNARP